MQKIHVHNLEIEYRHPAYARCTAFRKISYPPDQFTAQEWGLLLAVVKGWHAANYTMTAYPPEHWWRLRFVNFDHGAREYRLNGVMLSEVLELKEKLQRRGDRRVDIYEDDKRIFNLKCRPRIAPDALDLQLAQAGGY